MRILQLTTFYPPWHFGGDANFVQQLSRHLVGDGHHVEVVHCIDAYFAAGGTAPHEAAPPQSDGVVVHSLKSRAGVISPLLTQQTGSSWLKRRRIREILRSRRFDVVHMHNISLIGLDIADLLPSDFRPLILLTTHEHWLLCPMHVLWRYTNELCTSPACVRCSLANLRPPQWWRYTSRMRHFVNGVDGFLAPSRFTAQTHAERGFPREMTVLPNFVPQSDLDFESPRVSPHPRPYFLYVGRLEHIKGVHTLLSAWQSISGADLVLAGTGPLEPELRRQAHGDSRIRFLGKLPQPQLDPWYRHAVATIVPSLCYEVFPLVCIESFARRTPLIVRDFGALAEVVAESGGGLVYRDEAELIRCVQQLLASADQRDAHAEAGYEAYLQRWTPEVHLRQFYELIDSLRGRRLTPGRPPVSPNPSGEAR